MEGGGQTEEEGSRKIAQRRESLGEGQRAVQRGAQDQGRQGHKYNSLSLFQYSSKRMRRL